MIAPNDAISAAGRIDDPTRRTDVFTLKQEELFGYGLEVYGQKCGSRHCRAMDYQRVRCARGFNLAQGEAVTATVRLPSPDGDCKITLSPS